MKKLMGKLLVFLNRFADRWWYFPLLALISGADAFILIVSTELLMLPNVVAKPSRWFRISLYFTIGSALGATLFAALASRYGEGIVTYFFPHIFQSETWKSTVHLIHKDGFWGLALVSLSPFPQHAAVAVAGLAHMETDKVFIGVFIGRFVKYTFLCWASTHFPKILKKFHIRVPEMGPADSKKNGGSGGTKASI